MPTATTTPVTTPTTSTTTPPADTNEFLKALQDRLLGTSGMATSATSQIDKTIQGTIDTLQSSNDTTQAGIKASFDRQKIDAATQGQTALTSATESQRGFAVNSAVLSQVRDATTKSLRDLDLRETEALAAGQTDVATKIADLKLQKLDFQQKAEQSTFTNLLNASTQFLQQEQENRLMSTQQQEAKTQMSTIALKYGITLQPGDTIDSVVARAQPFASKEEALQLEQVKSEINKNNQQSAAVVKATQAGAGIAKARGQLESIASSSQDHYTDPALYTRLRADYAAAYGSVSAFDDAFAPLLSPQERARLGVGKASGVPALSDVTLF